ncbi:hypothetical protein M404DRAFT_997707 [Pisolithus tinctorius Marx 270]|uniref:Uncharacterized protein n=1 Tax=Pisolithus tinctorius Marx 270 TaxID=870435 RepID=A0A0C3PGM0_PISTI|nr:hypothetical protein M404DRAFT_997707 [Pisolithus tinctorius Marx 270]
MVGPRISSGAMGMTEAKPGLSSQPYLFAVSSAKPPRPSRARQNPVRLARTLLASEELARIC